MKPPHQLQLVLDKEENCKKDIAKRLEQALAFVEAEKDQLSQLQRYRNDYLEKIKSSQNGWSIEMMSRYRNFCYQLNDALHNQQNKIDVCDSRLYDLRQQLAKQQHKISVLQELLEKKQLDELIIENKYLQKEMDEISSRRAYHH